MITCTFCPLHYQLSASSHHHPSVEARFVLIGILSAYKMLFVVSLPFRSKIVDYKFCFSFPLLYCFSDCVVISFVSLLPG